MHERGGSQAPKVSIVLDEGRAWSLLRQLARSASSGVPANAGVRVSLSGEGSLSCAVDDGWIRLDDEAPHGWQPVAAVTPAARELLDLYLPLCVGPSAAELVVAHLGQSLDGRVATESGASRFITGPEDVRHTHRLRALFDAVVVGVGTVVADDPALTTRLVPGEQPTRVVIDPGGRAPRTARVLNDGAAPTLIVRADASSRSVDGAESVVVARGERGIDLGELLDALRARGLCRVFVEGGGITVSRMLEAGVLHRLHVTVAPTIIGSGTPAFRLPAVERLEDALRLRARRFRLGDDVLFDCDLHEPT